MNVFLFHNLQQKSTKKAEKRCETCTLTSVTIGLSSKKASYSFCLYFVILSDLQKKLPLSTK